MTIILLGQYAAAIAAVLGLAGLVVKWVIVIPIKAYIEKMTYAIQPHANGGNSLPDVVKSLQRIEKQVCDIDGRLVAVEDYMTKKSATRGSRITEK